MRVLIVEDEKALAKNISQMLNEQTSFATDVSHDGEDGLHMALHEPYDLIILDLMLPKIDGFCILQNLRDAGKDTPVLILTARDSSQDIIKGLDFGCDDYLTKPFEMGELIARCKALIRRSYNRPNPILKLDQLTVNTSSRSVLFNHQKQELTAMEYRVLEYMIMRQGDIVSKEALLDHLYGFDAERFSNVIEVYISSLRKRFGAKRIRTVRGLGYILE